MNNNNNNNNNSTTTSRKPITNLASRNSENKISIMKRNDSLSATSEHIISTSTSTAMCKRKQQTPQPFKVRRVASFTPSQHNNNGQQRKRLVRFNIENISHVVCEVPSRSDIAEEDFQNIWYIKEEFKVMKKESIPIIKKLVQKLPLDDNEEARGLEHKTPNGSKLRQQNRYQAMDAVLLEQERQWERDRKDDNYIAQIYRQSSAHCQMSAYLIGQKDAEEVAAMEVQMEETATEDNNETTSSSKAEESEFEEKDSSDENRGSVSPTTVVDDEAINRAVDDKETNNISSTNKYNNLNQDQQEKLLMTPPRKTSAATASHYMTHEVLSTQVLVTAL
jgi:hypothetical protein